MNSLTIRWTIATGLVLGGLAIALAMLEVTVRLFFAEPIKPRFVVDPGYGVRANQTNVRTRHLFPDQYDVAISTNKAGLRGTRDYSLVKPEDTFRIALLGDSFVFGHGVNDDEVSSSVLEDILNRPSGATRFEVLNFGVSGFGSAEELVTYRARVRLYKPNVVIVFYFSNDIGNTAVSDLFWVDDSDNLQPTGKNYLPGVKAREILYAIRPIRWLFENSQAWNLIRNRLSALVHHSELSSKGLRNSTEMNKSAVRLTKAVLLQLVKDIAQDGAVPGILVIPQRNLKSNFPLSPQSLERYGPLFLDGRAFLSGDDYFAVDGHWKPSGHAKAAAALKNVITDLPGD